MSWSINANGTDGETTIMDLHGKLSELEQCPPEMRDALLKAAAMISSAMTSPVTAASSAGHIGNDGKGYATIGLHAN